jgi:hypothetical protein
MWIVRPGWRGLIRGNSLLLRSDTLALRVSPASDLSDALLGAVCGQGDAVIPDEGWGANDQALITFLERRNILERCEERSLHRSPFFRYVSHMGGSPIAANTSLF